jgi:hypothetical protein
MAPLTPLLSVPLERTPIEVTEDIELFVGRGQLFLSGIERMEVKRPKERQ